MTDPSRLPMNHFSSWRAFLAATLLVFGAQPLDASPLLANTLMDTDQTERITLYELVTFDTNLGKFSIWIRDDAAPETASHFLDFIDTGAYSQSLIHRSETQYAIYGGRYRLDPTIGPSLIGSSPPITTEEGLINRRGTVAMVQRSPGEHADDEGLHWRINTADSQASQDQTFKRIIAFGEVAGDGMVLVDAINSLPIANVTETFDQLPLTIDWDPNDDFPQEHFVQVHAMTRLSQVEIISQSAPEIVEATLDGRELVLKSFPGVTGTSQITLQFTGNQEVFVETFEATVARFDFFGLPPEAKPDDSFWLGTFDDQYFNYETGRGWIRHAEHDWLYVGGKGYQTSLWFWDDIQQKWLWTRKSVYPFFYSDSSQTWFYYYRGGTPTERFFYDYRSPGTWEKIPEQ